MNRTIWLQRRRMEKFEDRVTTKRLSAMDVAELLGMSERAFLPAAMGGGGAWESV